jgi:hypothetical protein
VAIHERHLEFVFEITDGAEAADDETRSHGLGEVHQQALELLNAHAFVLRGRQPNQLQPLVGGKERTLG